MDNRFILPQDHIDYILASGFTRMKAPRHIRFSNGYRAFEIDPFFNSITFEALDDGDDCKAAQWTTTHSFSGLSHLSFHKFALLLHVTDTIDMKKNFKQVNAVFS